MFSRVRLCAVLLAFLLGSVWVSLSFAQSALPHQEVIRNFAVVVEVLPDGAVQVSEEIEVAALGQQIRRGIYRDIPLGGLGPFQIGAAPFDLVAAERDSRRETYRLESTADGVRVYLGREDVILEPGIYRYRLVYRMGDQVGRFADFDEIYWNATGHAWPFEIERAQVTIAPPRGARVTQSAAYTGRVGDSGTDYSLDYDQAGRPVFTSTASLLPGQGLTVAAGWPKGHVAPGPAGTGLHNLLRHYGGFLVVALTAGLVSLYYGLVWWQVGRDPAPGTIVPIYYPTFSPAAMRFIRRMAFDDICFSAAVLNLAVKGHLTIREVAGTPVLWRAEGAGVTKPMSQGEKASFAKLLGTRDRIIVDESGRGALDSAAEALKKYLRKTFDRHYFRRNYGWFAGGVAVTIAGWLASAAISVEQLFAFMIALFPTFMLIAMATVGSNAISLLRRYRRGREPGDLLATVAHFTLSGLFAVMMLVVSTTLLSGLGWLTILCLSVVALLNLLFFHLLKSPTAVGRSALDEIEGTRLYLSVAEADRLKFHNPPERTPEHFHEMLPYAVALDLETEWTNQFSEAIAVARTQGKEQEYLQPSWYSGSSGGPRSLGELRALGARLGNSLSAATAPRSSGFGSSGGSSGGGSSGGGGGGGGGGGW